MTATASLHLGRLRDAQSAFHTVQSLVGNLEGLLSPLQGGCVFEGSWGASPFVFGPLVPGLECDDL